MVNSAPVPGCPFCGSEALAKDGRRKDGVQKYLCRSCGRRFNPLTGTVFDSHKIPISEWIEYLLHLFEFHSVVTSARDNRNAHTTGVYWLRKVFAVLEGCQDSVVLSGDVWLDETYVSVGKKDRVTKGGKLLRGVSRNKIAIGVATDGRSVVAIPEWASKPSKKRTPATFGEQHRQRPQAYPRRRQLALAADRGAQPGKRSAPDLRDEGAPRFREPDGRGQRRAFAAEEVPPRARRLREGRPAGVVRPFLVHLVRSSEPHGESREVHRNGSFDSEKNQIPRGFQEKGR